MRRGLTFFFLCILPVTAQTIKDRADSALKQSLLGHWAGYPEYRDYSEPPMSTKRVRLPTWLEITPNDTGLSMHYIYDDRPNKVVDETEQVSFDLAHNTYTSKQAEHPPDTYQVDGFNSLRDGLGTLVLTGRGSDNDKPADMRITFTIRRNMLELLREARPVGSSDDFAFRHLYRFTRTPAPGVTKAR